MVKQNTLIYFIFHFKNFLLNLKTSESIVDTCITYHGCEMARSMRLTNKPNFFTFIQRKPLLKFRFYRGCLLAIYISVEHNLKLFDQIVWFVVDSNTIVYACQIWSFFSCRRHFANGFSLTKSFFVRRILTLSG